MDEQFTNEQFAALGRIIARTCTSGNRTRFEVSKELAGSALMLRVEYGSEAGTLLIGIEPDGYPHT